MGRLKCVAACCPSRLLNCAAWLVVPCRAHQSPPMPTSCLDAQKVTQPTCDSFFWYAGWLEHATNYFPKPVPADKFTDCYLMDLPSPCTLWSPASWSGEHGGQGPTTCGPTTWPPTGPIEPTDIPMPTEPWVPRTTAGPLNMLSFRLEYIVACRASQQDLFYAS